MTEHDLVIAFGQKNVVSTDVDLGEGETSPGTVLFPSDPFQRLEILWADKEHRQLPRQAQLTGTSKSRWNTTAGISLGTSLKELERINGKPFHLSGFETDYSGTVSSWDGGSLDKEFHGAKVIIRLVPTNKSGVTPAEFDTVTGSLDFSSINSVMQRLNPEIYQIVWMFR
jgi:hypothetical protein